MNTLTPKLKEYDSKKIIYRGKEPYFRYEFFVINEEGRKLWSSGPQSLKGDDDSNDDNHLGWCDIRIDPQQLVPWKYSYTETNERP